MRACLCVCARVRVRACVCARARARGRGGGCGGGGRGGGQAAAAAGSGVRCASPASLVTGWVGVRLGGGLAAVSGGGSFHYHGLLALAGVSPAVGPERGGTRVSVRVSGASRSGSGSVRDASTVRCRVGNGSSGVLARRVDASQLECASASWRVGGARLSINEAATDMKVQEQHNWRAALAVLGQGCLLAFWFAAATHIASSGLLEFNADGFAHLTYGSTLKAMVDHRIEENLFKHSKHGESMTKIDENFDNVNNKFKFSNNSSVFEKVVDDLRSIVVEDLVDSEMDMRTERMKRTRPDNMAIGIT